MEKIVFFDIDGTIWDDNTNIPQSTIDAIRLLRKNGHKAIICSGRSRSAITSEKLWAIGFDGVIAACGNHVELDGKILYEKILSKETTRRIVELCEKHHMPMVLEGPNYQWISPKGFEQDPYVDYLVAEIGERAVWMYNGYTEDMRINKFSADIIEGSDFEAVKKGLEQELDFLIHDGYVVETMPKGSSKATGIKWLCEYLGVKIEDTYALGDSVNDLEMLKLCGHGIAMGNGTKEAKEAAEYVTASLHEDGVQKALAHYNLI